MCVYMSCSSTCDQVLVSQWALLQQYKPYDVKCTESDTQLFIQFFAGHYQRFGGFKTILFV